MGVLVPKNDLLLVELSQFSRLPSPNAENDIKGRAAASDGQPSAVIRRSTDIYAAYRP